MLQYDTFEDQTKRLFAVSDSVRKRVLDRLELDEAVAGLLISPRVLPVGASTGVCQGKAQIKLNLGTFFYLLDEVPVAFRFAPVAQFAQGRQCSDCSTMPDQAHVRIFSLVLGAIAISILTAHELCHALNGHFYIENYSRSPCSSEELRRLEATTLQMDANISLATEFNADLAGIVWTLEALFDEGSHLYHLIKESEEFLRGITTAAGTGGILAFVIAVLAKTYRTSPSAKLRHPKPWFRVEALRRAVTRFLRMHKKDAELDSFLSMRQAAVDFVIPNLRPTVTDFTQRQPDEPGEWPNRVQQGWRRSELFQEKHRIARTLCLREEMYNWTETLGW